MNRLLVHPGHFVQDELAERCWTQVHLAHVIGVSAPYLGDLIRGRRDISAPMAVRLSAAFGSSPEFWLNLDRDWRLAHVEGVDVEAIRRRAREAS